MDDRGCGSANRVDRVALGLAAIFCTLTLIDVFVRLVGGAGIDLGEALSDGTRLTGAIVGLLVIGNIAFGFLGWLRTRAQR